MPFPLHSEQIVLAHACCDFNIYRSRRKRNKGHFFGLNTPCYVPRGKLMDIPGIPHGSMSATGYYIRWDAGTCHGKHVCKKHISLIFDGIRHGVCQGQNSCGPIGHTMYGSTAVVVPPDVLIEDAPLHVAWHTSSCMWKITIRLLHGWHHRACHGQRYGT